MYSTLILSLLPALAWATYGVDVSQRVTQSSWSCLKGTGAQFAITRVYQSTGNPDPNGAANINDARAAGIAYVDGYIFPCYSCGNPAKQMDDTINSLKSAGVALLADGLSHEEYTAQHNHTGAAPLTATAGMLWIDVEGTQYWSSSTSNNVNFIQGMVDEGNKQGVHLGIYTSKSQWDPITGGSTQFKSYDLWYPHYDNSKSFSDFVSFGGWSKPAIKQYMGDVSSCSVGIDQNYY